MVTQPSLSSLLSLQVRSRNQRRARSGSNPALVSTIRSRNARLKGEDTPVGQGRVPAGQCRACGGRSMSTYGTNPSARGRLASNGGQVS